MRTIFTMSLYATAMIGITAFLRLILLKRTPKAVFKLLWLAAAARMLIPIFFKVPVYVQHGSSVYAAEQSASGSGIVPAVYILGVTAVSAFFAAAYIRGLKKYKDTKIVYNSGLSKLISSAGLLRKVEIRVSGKVCTPVTYGIFRPKIICPADLFEYEETQIKYAVYHELVHIKRVDAAYKLAVTAAVCVHWFNPFAWLMLALSERDTELACDEEVLVQLGGREEYALALLAFEEKRSTAVFNAFGQNAVKERIELIMKFKKTTAAFAAAAAIAICTAAVFAVSPAVRENDAGEQQTGVNEGEIGSTTIAVAESEMAVGFYGSSGRSVSGESYGVLSHSDSVETSAVQPNENGFIVFYFGESEQSGETNGGSSYGVEFYSDSAETTTVQQNENVVVFDPHGDRVQPNSTNGGSYGVLSHSD